MLQRLRSRLNREEGFTLIELLVVILIIGILAAIAIPSFLNQKGKGEDASAKSAARTAQTAFETFYTDAGNYTDCGSGAACVTKLKGIEEAVADFGTAKGNITVATTDATGYTVTVLSSDGRTFTIDKNGGTATRSCTQGSSGNKGGCPDGLSW